MLSCNPQFWVKSTLLPLGGHNQKGTIVLRLPRARCHPLPVSYGYVDWQALRLALIDSKSDTTKTCKEAAACGEVMALKLKRLLPECVKHNKTRKG